MAARLALVLATAFLGLMLGLAFAPKPSATVTATHPLHIATARLDPPAVAAAQAALAFAGGERPPVTAAPPHRTETPPPATPQPAPAPPPPPPESELRRSVSAVADEPGGLALVLAGEGRRLRAGDTFMGWRIASVTRAGAILTRGREQRAASFFGPSLSSRVASPNATPPSRPAASQAPATPPTAAEYFRGFKG